MSGSSIFLSKGEGVGLSVDPLSSRNFLWHIFISYECIPFPHQVLVYILKRDQAVKEEIAKIK